MAIRIQLEGSGQVLDTAELERIYPWAGDALHRETVDVDGLVGTLWRPHGGENLPAVLLLGGSGGASQSMRSALLAARGYAVLDLLYFGRDPLPRELIEIPLEYFVAGRNCRDRRKPCRQRRSAGYFPCHPWCHPLQPHGPHQSMRQSVQPIE